MFETVKMQKERDKQTVATFNRLHLEYADLTDQTFADLVSSWHLWDGVDERIGIDVDSFRKSVAQFLWGHIVTFTEPLTDEKMDHYKKIRKVGLSTYHGWPRAEKELKRLLSSWNRSDLTIGFYSPRKVEGIANVSGSLSRDRRLGIMRYDKYLRGQEKPMTSLEEFAWSTGSTVKAEPLVVKEIMVAFRMTINLLGLAPLCQNFDWAEFKLLFRKPPPQKKIKVDPGIAKAKRRGYLKDNLSIGSYSVGSCSNTTSASLEEAANRLEKVLYHAKLHKGALADRVPEEVAEISTLIEELEASVSFQVEAIRRKIHTLSMKITANNFD